MVLILALYLSLEDTCVLHALQVNVDDFFFKTKAGLSSSLAKQKPYIVLNTLDLIFFLLELKKIKGNLQVELWRDPLIESIG